MSSDGNVPVWSVQCLEDKVICEVEVPTVKGLTTIRSPTFWHSKSTKWCMKVSKESTNLKVLFVLLSSQRDLSVKGELKATVKCEGGESAVDKAWTGPLNQLGNRHFVFRVANNAESLSVRGEVTLPAEQHSVTADLGALLASGNLSDVVLCTQGVELRAHSVILAARSPLFAATLRQEKAEGQRRRLTVKNVEPDVLQQVLSFIYTGRAPRMRDTADLLLAAAETCRLQGLKTLCEQHLAEALTVDNAAAAGVLALRHCCDLLRPAVVSFIRENVVPVVRSGGWIAAMRKNPQDVVEMTCWIAENIKVT